MDELAPVEPVERDGQGRFMPGQSGNPAGKKPGTRNHATLWREMLGPDIAAETVRVLVDHVREGHFAAARFLADRVFPKPRGRAITLALPDGVDGTSNARAVFDAALRGVLSGAITPDEAAQVGALLRDRLQFSFAPLQSVADHAVAAPAVAEPTQEGPASVLHSQAAAGNPPPRFQRRRRPG